MLLILANLTQNLQAENVKLKYKPQEHIVLAQYGQNQFDVSTVFPELTFKDSNMPNSIPDIKTISSNLEKSKQMKVEFAPVALNGGQLYVTLCFEWSERESILRKWAELRITESNKPVILNEIILEKHSKSDIVHNFIVQFPQSFPVFFKACFAGIEFPVASTRAEGDFVLIGHRPGVKLEPGKLYESQKAVFGFTKEGDEIDAFKKYIAANHPQPHRIFTNYNFWFTLPPGFYTSQEVLSVMKSFEENLYKPYGVSIDAFVLDCPWSNPQSIWQVNSKAFPNGLGEMQAAANAMNSNLGIWISPSCYYSSAVDVAWAATNGYEVFDGPLYGPAGNQKPVQLCCMGGKKYGTEFREQLVRLVKQYNMKHIKIDGYSLTCPAANHGHEPGMYSAEAIAQSGINTFKAVREVEPDIWLEPTCFGNPSPWWLFYVNSVTGFFGDDSPWGRVPAPVYRESYTTARDYFNLQGAATCLVPIFAQEVLGITHQTSDDFTNDGVMTVLRGHDFLTLYMNPKFMDKRRWKTLADLISWARRNYDILQQTEIILPSDWQSGQMQFSAYSHSGKMPRQLYGYVHSLNDKCIIVLRNPWIACSHYKFKLNQNIGLNQKSGIFSIVSIYPEVRKYGENLRYGQDLEIPLAPYETLVLQIEKNQKTFDLPGVEDRNYLSIRNLKKTVCQEDDSTFEAHVQVDVDVNAPQSQLIVLLEGKKTPSKPDMQLTLNGKAVKLYSIKNAENTFPIVDPNETGWASSWAPIPESWRFMIADIGYEGGSIDLKFKTDPDCKKISAWIIAMKSENNDAKYPNMLPSPERIYLDSKVLIEDVSVAKTGL
ncbi:MAG: hypothetical protein A2Y10_10315 [Planctomycetes bacterium GWF2_41_51]|nr:MAG: hypothetical protein A2Y10_10315 [Planctomycetes bacterium GWF2_41_51]HBG27665.1 hypothetical protein [Phycisphaerales bacterium]